MNPLYHRIEVLCGAESLTVTALCRELGITRTVLSELKAGRTRALSAEYLNRIALRFGVTVAYLLGREEPPAPPAEAAPDGVFAATLERLCLLWERTPAQLAAATGVPLPRLHALRRGETPPTAGERARLAAHFRVEPALFDPPTSDAAANLVPLPPPPRTRRVPVLGSVPAGIPIEAVEDIVDYIDLPAPGGDCFALRVRGDSMTPEYRDGDTVVVQTDALPRSGDDVVAYVGPGEATLKRLQLDGSIIRLLPLNPAYRPMTFTAEQAANLPLTFAGVVTELRRKRK